MVGKAQEKAGIGVISRAAAILRVLGDTPTGMSLGQIAGRVGLARSTVQRLTNALESEGLILSGTGAGRISLGPELIRLARQARPALMDRMRPYMEELSGKLGETVDFSIVQRDKIVFLDQVVGSERLLAVSHVGDAFPLHCSSVGKAYLATLADDEIRRLIGDRYERRTPRTVTDLARLGAALEPIRQSGIGIDEEEHCEGICAVGIVFDAGARDWYGLSVPIPVGRFPAKRAQAEAFLKRTRAQLGDILGEARSRLRAVR